MPDDQQWHTTANHDTIRNWAAVHDAVPTVVERAGGERALRFKQEELAEEAVSWDRFFEQLDKNELAVQYRERDQETTLQEEYEIVPRDDTDRDLAAEKTTEPDAKSDQLATSDTGSSEPVIFDQVAASEESESTVGDERERLGGGERADSSEQSTPMSESARGSVDAAEAIVLSEIHERGVGPSEWHGSDEYIVLENDGKCQVDLSGWTVENGVGESYRFGEPTVLESGEQLVLHSESGEDTEKQRYWATEESVWPKTGGTVRVETETGEQVLRESYKNGH